MIASVQGGTSKKESGAQIVETGAVKEGAKSAHRKRSGSFISDELTALAGNVQAQTGLVAAKGIGLAVAVQQPLVSGIAVKTTDAEGDPKISIAKDLGTSPSSILNPQKTGGALVEVPGSQSTMVQASQAKNETSVAI
ncbi:MAG TPA: hypothetical protein VMH23_18275, partial [Bacteroidota bacterium]|nr:hypothetical protein [Bacteroidota bacterium]